MDDQYPRCMRLCRLYWVDTFKLIESELQWKAFGVQSRCDSRPGAARRSAAIFATQTAFFLFFFLKFLRHAVTDARRYIKVRYRVRCSSRPSVAFLARVSNATRRSAAPRVPYRYRFT